MATEVVTTGRVRGLVRFVQDSYTEVRHKTTWPDGPQVRQASIAIIIFVLLVGLLITVLDLLLRLILVQGIPALFR